MAASWFTKRWTNRDAVSPDKTKRNETKQNRDGYHYHYHHHQSHICKYFFDLCFQFFFFSNVYCLRLLDYKRTKKDVKGNPCLALSESPRLSMMIHSSIHPSILLYTYIVPPQQASKQATMYVCIYAYTDRQGYKVSTSSRPQRAKAKRKKKVAVAIYHQSQ